MIWAPNAFSIVLVIASVLPNPSAIDTCEVDGNSRLRSSACASSEPGGRPGMARCMLRSPISAARCRR